MNRSIRIATMTAVLLGSVNCSSDTTAIAERDDSKHAGIASIVVTLTPSTALVGTTAMASAMVLDQSGVAMNRAVSWSSSNTAVATVTSAGIVTAVAAGTADITASSASVTGTARLVVTTPTQPPASVASVSVSLSSSSTSLGQIVQATATLRDSASNVLVSRPITWSSDNNAVAVVSAAGVVTTLSVGSAHITATSEGKSGSATIVVTVVPVVSVAVSLNASALTVGQSTQASATTRDVNSNILTGRVIVWSSSNNSVATVSAAGLVTAVAAGTAQITATSEGVSGNTGVAVNVPAAVPVATVSVTLGSSTLVVAQTTQATATTRDASSNVLTGRVIGWSSSNSAVASVSATGVVTAVAAGSAQITATSEGKTGSATVTVNVPAPVPVATVSVVLNASSLVVAQTTQATATTRDASNNVLTGRVIAWSSSNTGIATVSTSGVVTAVAAGSAQITATSEGQTGSATIAVTAPAPAPSAGCSPAQPGWIWCDDFEVDRTASYFEYDNSGGKFVRAASVGVNGSTGMRGRFNAGTVNAGSLHLAFGRTPSSYIRPVDAGTANYRDVYWRMRVRFQSGWVGGGADKLSRSMILANSNWAQAMIAPVWSSGPQNTQIGIDPESGTDLAGNLVTTVYNDSPHIRWLGLGVGPTTIFDAAHAGQWHCVEAHVKLNDAGLTNGVMEVWINGVLEAQRTNLNWVGAYSAYGINAIFFENYWNAGSPVAQERYFDDIVVSTQRIGC